MTQISGYNLRIKELHENGYDNGVISKKIHYEYGIRLSSVLINEKLSEKKIIEIRNSIGNDLNEKIIKIKNVLSFNNFSPKNSLEISNLLRYEKNIRLTKSEVSRLIFTHLKDEIIYDSKNYLIRLKNEVVEETEVVAKPVTNFDKLAQLGSINVKESYIINSFQNFFKNIYITIDTGNEKLDNLIKAVVKDNIITECEKIFLKQKASELGLTEDIIDKAEKARYENNPYLDNVIHVIFDDGIISTEELNFLKEKTIENHFKESFVNKRFWVIGIAIYLKHLLKIEGFYKILKLFFLADQLKFNSLKDENWLFSKLDIFKEKDLASIISYTIECIEDDLINFIESKQDIKGKDFINEAYEKIKFQQAPDVDDENTEKPQTNKAEVKTNTIKPDVKNDLANQESFQMEILIKIISEEKRRIGDPAANLLAENILFALKN